MTGRIDALSRWMWIIWIFCGGLLLGLVAAAVFKRFVVAVVKSEGWL
jgi:hypothetical protein